MEYSELHDATLQMIQLRWAEGTVRIDVAYFKDGARCHAAVLGRDVSGVCCPRALPWGESKSINEVSVEELVGGSVLRIEMQSGDELIFRAQVFALGTGPESSDRGL